MRNALFSSPLWCVSGGCACPTCLHGAARMPSCRRLGPQKHWSPLSAQHALCLTQSLRFAAGGSVLTARNDVTSALRYKSTTAFRLRYCVHLHLHMYVCSSYLAHTLGQSLIESNRTRFCSLRALCRTVAASFAGPRWSHHGLVEANTLGIC
ncbi:hypothetical protein QBC46DRAFT_180684 [Diplogelasinospora grovesii]|uniref:Secreted protein n=1 Tax=Diplogelasinospora grovesii TaxID=303347 RepID=A0AAN6N1R2_9PEZI|nr:hypothetical protein QBC46DRAFT_180684 [Diplogelasinospora grovesii]